MYTLRRKNEEEKNIIAMLIGIVLSSSFLIRTILIHQARQAKKQNLERIAAVQETVQSQEKEKAEEQREHFKKAFEGIDRTSIQMKDYDSYTKINGDYSFGTKDGIHYLVELKTGEKVALEGVDKAFPLSIKNEDENSTELALVVRKDQAWYMIDTKGETIYTFEQTELTENSKLTLKDNKLQVE